jgi:nucleoside-diphosphate-sugar epimerase
MNYSIKGKKILLIGGAGFIGHNLALELKNNGAEVSILDSLGVNNLLHLNSTNNYIEHRELYLRFVNSRLKLLEDAKINVFVEDAREYHKMSKVFSEVKPEVVIVLAAVSHANKSNKDPFNTFDHSLRTLENALDNSKNKIDHLIYFSSSMVYGHFPPGGVTEDTELNPIGIYGALKVAGEKIVKAYNQVFDLPFTIVRPSALYGERCISQRVGQIFIEQAINGKEITINGDGKDSLDFTYIKDLALGIQKVIESKNSRNEIFNLTYGESRTIGQMAEILVEHFHNVKINYQQKDHLTPDRGTLSIEKARNLIDYNPRFPLEVGYLNYIKWYKEFFNK